MVNLICFPHYTCGGLLCDILSGNFSKVGKNGGIESINHSIGKIGDANTVLVDYDVDVFLQQLKEENLSNNDWVGTHCWLGKLPVEKFNKIIVVSTSTYQSKIYRWVRAYNHY